MCFTYTWVLAARLSTLGVTPILSIKRYYFEYPTLHPYPVTVSTTRNRQSERDAYFNYVRILCCQENLTYHRSVSTGSV